MGESADEAERRQAIAAVQAGQPGPADGISYKATRVSEVGLWNVVAVDGSGLAMPGHSTLVGPDQKLWTISSNPLIHDFALAVSTLEALYRAEVAGSLGHDRFFEWLSIETQRRHKTMSDLLDEARAADREEQLAILRRMDETEHQQ